MSDRAARRGWKASLNFLAVEDTLPPSLSLFLSFSLLYLEQMSDCAARRGWKASLNFLAVEEPKQVFLPELGLGSEAAIEDNSELTRGIG